MARSKVKPPVEEDPFEMEEAQPPAATGLAVRKPIPVRFTVAGPGELGTIETDRGPMDHRDGDVLLAEGDRVWPVDRDWFDRHYRVVSGDDAESAYEETYPKFSTGGVAYVRATCPNCDQTAIFAAELGEKLQMGDGGSKLSLTFHAKAKEHLCGQMPARLEEVEDAPDGDADESEDDDE